MRPISIKCYHRKGSIIVVSRRFFQARRDPSRFSQTSSENPTDNRSPLRYQGKSRYLSLRIYDLMVTGGFAVV
jgi:hypothetical protein